MGNTIFEVHNKLENTEADLTKARFLIGQITEETGELVQEDSPMAAYIMAGKLGRLDAAGSILFDYIEKIAEELKEAREELWQDYKSSKAAAV